MPERSKSNSGISNKRSSYRRDTRHRRRPCSLTNLRRSRRIVPTTNLDTLLGWHPAGYNVSGLVLHLSRCDPQPDGAVIAHDRKTRSKGLGLLHSAAEVILANEACSAAASDLRRPRIFQIPRQAPATMSPTNTQSNGADHFCNVPVHRRIKRRP